MTRFNINLCESLRPLCWGSDRKELCDSIAVMRLSMPILIIAVAVAGCVGPQVPSLDAAYSRMPDKDLWYSMRWTGAFNELRCRGLNPKLARAEYDRRFGDREGAIDAAMIAKYGPVKDGEG